MPAASSSSFALRSDLESARDLGPIAGIDDLRVRAAQGNTNVWLGLSLDESEVAYLRLGPNAGEITNVQTWSKSDGSAGCEFTTSLGPMRAKLTFHEGGTLRCITSILPVQDVRIEDWPRDFFAAAADGGTVHTSQRGLRSGIVFAGGRIPVPFSVFYFQNFGSLTEYFTETKRTPSDTVGGVWPELGYAPPTGDECILPKAREIVVSDAFISITDGLPQSEDSVAAYTSTSLPASIVCSISRPQATTTGLNAPRTLYAMCRSRRCARTSVRAGAISCHTSPTRPSRRRAWSNLPSQ
jgi:hypothetical protein